MALHNPSANTGPSVTDAQRYFVLQDAAETLIRTLADQFLVEWRETKEPLDGGPDGLPVRVVRLIPHSPAAAPLSVYFTDFPSVILRLGRWFQQSLPRCGCDECDEDPGELIAEFRAQVAALIEGGLWERVRRELTGSWAETRLIGPDFRIAQRAQLEPSAARAARREGFAAAVQWAPWPRRAGTVGGV